MGDELLTAEDVAKRLKISVNLVKRLTKSEGWPCIKFSAKTIRYTDDHVEQIKALNETAAANAAGISGRRSRGRSS